MYFPAIFLVISAIGIVSVASYGRGENPLNNADDVSSVRPNCPSDRFGNKYVPCATPDVDDISNWPCVKITDLCNDRLDCPNGEDEHPMYCFFHKLRASEMNKLRKALEQIKG